MKSMVSPAVYIPVGASRSSNRDHPRSWSWKTSRPQSYAIVTERIGSWWTYRNVIARVRSSQFGEPDRDDRVRSRPNRRLDRNNPIGTYVSVSEREFRPWLIVTPEIDKSCGSHPSATSRIRTYRLASPCIQTWNFRENSTISYEWPIVAFVTDRTTVET